MVDALGRRKHGGVIVNHAVKPNSKLECLEHAPHGSSGRIGIEAEDRRSSVQGNPGMTGIDQAFLARRPG